jgi:hypothetical protein
LNAADREHARANNNILHNFYTAMKRTKDFIRFSLVTGINRFVFDVTDSGPNNFVDISLMPKFAGICGFTIKEFSAFSTTGFHVPSRP